MRSVCVAACVAVCVAACMLPRVLPRVLQRVLQRVMPRVLQRVTMEGRPTGFQVAVMVGGIVLGGYVDRCVYTYSFVCCNMMQRGWCCRTL